MTNYVYIDTVLQVFESDGNLHIVGAVSSGETDPKGKDVLEKTLHLTIPMSKALKIIPEISASLPQLQEHELVHSTEPEIKVPSNNDEFEGEGIHFKI